MERLKKERKEARRRFTKAKNELQNLLDAYKKDTQNYDALKISYTFLSQIATNLFDVDRRVQEQWLSEEETEEDAIDFDLVDTYRKDWIRMEHECSKLEHAESKYDSLSMKSFDKHRFRLPKLQLPKFDGNAKKWIGFWSSFKKIHNDTDIDDDDKMAYLIQSMTEDSPAFNLVKSYPPCGENYTQAVEQLKARYARDELLVEIYVRELLSLVLRQKKENNPTKLSKLYDELKTQLRALELLGVTSEKYAAMLYPLVESALPAEILRVWERQRISKLDLESQKVPLHSLLNFIKVEVESEERIQLTRQNISSGDKENERTKIPTATCLAASDERESPSTSSTLSVLLCPEVKKPEGETAENTKNVLAAENNGTTLLQTLLVKINGQTVRALIDTGAQRTYIKTEIVKNLDLKPKGEKILKNCLFGAVETKQECHKIYELTVTNMKGDVKMEMIALGKNTICGYIPRVNHDTTICQKIKEKGLNLTDIGDNTPEIGLLIGADYAAKLATGSMIHLDKDLYAIQTKLGWTLQGILSMNHDMSTVTATVDLTTDINQLWNLEVIGKEVIGKEEPKDKVLTSEGRYEVELPWKIEKPEPWPPPYPQAVPWWGGWWEPAVQTQRQL